MLPPLVLQMPQVGGLALQQDNFELIEDEEFNPASSEVDIAKVLRRRTERLQEQLKDQNIGLSQVQQESLPFPELSTGSSDVVVQELMPVSDLALLMGGESILSVLQSEDRECVTKLKKALLRGK